MVKAAILVAGRFCAQFVSPSLTVAGHVCVYCSLVGNSGTTQTPEQQLEPRGAGLGRVFPNHSRGELAGPALQPVALPFVPSRRHSHISRFLAPGGVFASSMADLVKHNTLDRFFGKTPGVDGDSSSKGTVQPAPKLGQRAVKRKAGSMLEEPAACALMPAEGNHSQGSAETTAMLLQSHFADIADAFMRLPESQAGRWGCFCGLAQDSGISVVFCAPKAQSAFSISDFACRRRGGWIF